MVEKSENLVTIGITSFREGAWLRECWESVLAQEDDRWEAVIVQDAGASPETREVFDSLEHPRLRKHRLDRRGLNSGTRNQAFAMTRTPYHFYLDADDMLFPSSVGRAITAFERNPEAAFVYGDLQIFGKEERIMALPREYSLDDWGVRQVITGAAVYRKDAWEKVGGLVSDPDLAEKLYRNNDYDFHLGLAEAGFKGVHCGDVYYRYRTHGQEQVCSGPVINETIYQTYPLMVERHPRYFADEARRVRFLIIGHVLSWRALLAQRDADRSREVARSAWRHLGPTRLVRLGRRGRRMLLAGALPLSAWRALVRRVDFEPSAKS